MNLATMPEWLADVARSGRPYGERLRGADSSAVTFDEGSRNTALFKLGSAMRRRGASEATITAALVEANECQCDPPLEVAEVIRIAKQAARYEPEPREVPAAQAPSGSIILRPLGDIVTEYRNPAWLLRDILEKLVLFILAGPRGTLKSFILLHWLMRAALAGHGVVLLSAEGAGLGRRAEAWARTHAPDLDWKALPFVALERGLTLSMADTMRDLADAIATLPGRPAVVGVDTISKYAAGLDENDNAEMASFLSSLSLNIRDRFQTSVGLVAHTGHSDSSRPRGASALMANPDAEYIVSRPDPRGMLVHVTRDRFKDAPSLPALTYEASVVDLGRLDDDGRTVTSLALQEINTPPAARPRTEPKGDSQRALLDLLRDLASKSTTLDVLTWSLEWIRALARTELGMSKTTAYTAVAKLTRGGHLLEITSGQWGVAP